MFDPCMVSLSNHQLPRSNVLPKYAAHQLFARLASEIFLSCQQQFFYQVTRVKFAVIPAKLAVASASRNP
jgi:hypothetical protein